MNGWYEKKGEQKMQKKDKWVVKQREEIGVQMRVKTEDEHIFEQEVDTTHSRGAVSVNKLEKKRGMNEMTTSKILPKKREFFHGKVWSSKYFSAWYDFLP